MAIHDDKWFECWFVDGQDMAPYYFLIVVSDPQKHEEFIVLDPLKSNEIVFHAKTYEEICKWLTEDEYQLIEGRMFPDDGW